jgi:5-methylcytosine-specific restriction enzyme A
VRFRLGEARMYRHPWRDAQRGPERLKRMSDILYSHRRWRRLRKLQLQREPLCRRCAHRGLVVPANTVDHVIPWRGDRDQFFLGELQSMCKECHDAQKTRDDKQLRRRGWIDGTGEDGLPLDRGHPAWR